MRASPVIWTGSRDVITRRIISENTELQKATEIFISKMSDITPETLGLEGSARFTRARAQRDMEQMEEYVRQAQNAIEINLAAVDTDLNGVLTIIYIIL